MKNEITERQELEQAENYLNKAEADLEMAKASEEKALNEIEEALTEIKEAETHQHHEIHFSVDGEQEETMKREMTPNEIISEYGKRDPLTNYLVQIIGDHQQFSYKDKGNEPIKLHNNMSFQIISLGPTPVSHGPIHTGVEIFIEGLRTLNYNPIDFPGKSDSVIIDYKVQSGRFAGQNVRHCFIVPADFPLTSPSGPHVSPHIHPINTSGAHPQGSIQQSPLGDEWQYWSRPFPNWSQSKRSVGVYLSHIWRLWDTQ